MTEGNFLDVEDQKEVKRIWLVIISVMLVVFLCFLWHGYNSYLKGTESEIQGTILKVERKTIRDSLFVGKEYTEVKFKDGRIECFNGIQDTFPVNKTVCIRSKIKRWETDSSYIKYVESITEGVC